MTLAACGGSGGESTAAGDGDGRGGDPVKVMALGPIDAPSFSIPSIAVGAKAGVEAVNAAGGAGGREVELILCDDGNDPNTAAGCARRAVKEGVAAIVGGYTAFEPQVVPIVERAGIPWIGPTALQNSTSPSYWLLGGEGATLAFAMGFDLVARSCARSAGIGESLSPVKAGVGLFDLGVKAAGGTTAEAAYGAQGTADWAPVVAAATGAGADCLAILSSPATAPQIVTAAAQSGRAIELTAPLSVLPAQSVSALGGVADGTTLMSGYLPFSADAPAVRRLRAQARAIDPEVPLDAVLESTYAATLVFAEAARGLDEVDAESVAAALPRVRGFDTGLGPVVDFSAENPARAFARVVNTKVFVLRAQDGEIVLAQPEPIDTLPAFEALAAAGR
ncbi:MAG TPA: ABC transporter substrate-binding protein [Conexibacter sp.]|nr:ABC transporter substrate-binding protein [Conexibacter sp.]